MALAYFSVKGDRLWARSTGKGTLAPSDAESQTLSWRSQRTLSPAIAISYAFVLSLLAFDLIMSLDPHWYSTLFGGYYFIGSFYSGVVVLYLLALASMDSRSMGEYISPRHLHDLGKLVLAFSLFTGYLFYTQFLVIWYGNLPEETQYVILRVKLSPWEPLAWVVLFMIFLIPFVVLLSRRIKMRRVPMILLSVMILTGMWLERFILVAPSVWKQGDYPDRTAGSPGHGGILGARGALPHAFLEEGPDRARLRSPLQATHCGKGGEAGAVKENSGSMAKQYQFWKFKQEKTRNVSFDICYSTLFRISILRSLEIGRCNQQKEVVSRNAGMHGWGSLLFFAASCFTYTMRTRRAG